MQRWYFHKIKAFNRLKDIFHQESFCGISSQSSKLRTYGKLKTEPGREAYLDDIKNITERTALTKLRLSNHDLLIEKGRHQGLSKHDRFCPFCKSSIETEEHFLIKCQTFLPLRKELYNKIKYELPFFMRANDNQKFQVLTSEPTVAHITANYLQKAFEIRRFLLANLKPNDWIKGFALQILIFIIAFYLLIIISTCKILSHGLDM